MTSILPLEHTFAQELAGLSMPWTAEVFPSPRLVALNDELATHLGVDPGLLRSPGGVQLLVGQVPPEVTTVAQVYAGHQFGGYAPRLGDGRALLLGEVIDRAGHRRDLHLKGSGRTPLSRGADGKAAIGPMLREYIIGEALHALGIPTTRALSVVATGEQVVRETLLPGAVLCRVAASHLRVGSFQYAAATGDRDLLRRVADHAISRCHPEAAQAENPVLELYRRVVDAQADLVARWMLVGFVHGVMNTDNMAISGESIDFGPCAFMDAFDPATVFSSIDQTGRYAYGNQPRIAQWNLARLGEALLPLIDENEEAAVEAATPVLAGFAARYESAWSRGMAAKLGLDAAEPSSVRDLPSLVRDLMVLLHGEQVDYTGFFRALSAGTARELFADPAPFDAWAARREALLGPDRQAIAAAMDRVNPVYIPRNHLVEEALAVATAGRYEPVHELVEVISRPFEVRADAERFAIPQAPGGPRYVTYCGT